MKKNYIKYLKIGVLTSVLPFIYGCGSGVSSLSSFLFGSGSSGLGGEISLLGGAVSEGVITSGGGSEVATLVNPEPASMLLLGGGLMAMTYFKSKISSGKK